MRLFVTIISAFFLAACSITSPDMNRPQSDKQRVNLPRNDRADDLTLFLTFSGGGTRSAALSYGVLQEFRDTRITINNRKRRLLDEVDLISSVSGGSFTSAYFGLFGDRLFKDFEKRFLKRRVQTELLRLSLLSPRAWIRLAPSIFERSDLAAEYYNQLIFKKKTFGDLRPDAPYIIINATDLSLGQGFSFTDYHFNWICSDLYSYPIARAVAASAAVPVLFSPITLANHAKRCRNAPTTRPNRNRDLNVEKRYQESLRIQEYRSDKRLKYLHLVDGGVADNLGMRSLLDIITNNNDNLWDTMKNYRLTNTKQLVFVVVNAASFQNPNLGKYRRSPSTFNVVDTTTTIQSNKYNVETLDLLRSKFPKWKKQVQQGRCREKPAKDCGHIRFRLIELSLYDLTPAEIKKLGPVPTALELPAKTIDRLIAAGKNLTRRSAGFKAFLQSYPNR